MKRTSVQLQDDVYAAVRRRAKERGVNASEYMRQAIDAQLAMEDLADLISQGGDPNMIADPGARTSAIAEAMKLIRRRRGRSSR